MGINGIGNANAIGFKRPQIAGRPTLPAALRNSLKLVCNCYNKTNNDSDRSVIKNLVDPDNPMIANNFSWKLNNGYGKYAHDFTTWLYSSTGEVTINNQNNYFTINSAANTTWFLLAYNTQNTEDFVAINGFKIKITGSNVNLKYKYFDEDRMPVYVTITEIGEYVFPQSMFDTDPSMGDIKIGFIGDGICDCTITQIPEFEHALITDGIDDNIISTKSMTEMLNGSNEFTVISMIHHFNVPASADNFSTNLAYKSGKYASNYVNHNAYDLIGIYGYTYNYDNPTQNMLLGDEKLYGTYLVSDAVVDKFYILNPFSLSQIGWYWTIIANKVLTNDEINLIIEYYNLDAVVVPQIYYDVYKQGLTNENHNNFNDKLIDFSGNNFDAELININWKDNSGVGSYIYNFENVIAPDASLTYKSITVLPTFINDEIFRIQDDGVIPSIQVKISGIPTNGRLTYVFYDELNGLSHFEINNNGIYILPKSVNDLPNAHVTKMQIDNHDGFDYKNIIIEQIPEYENALVFNGVDDYAVASYIPTLTDYTIVVKRKIIDYNKINAVISKYLLYSGSVQHGAFLLFETKNALNTNIYSFGKLNQVPVCDKDVIYQSKYVYNKIPITAGHENDFGFMHIGISIPTDTRYFANMALYYLLVFPYSMSEFLINRQLKKYKLDQI